MKSTDVLGKPAELTAIEALGLLESAISEGLSTKGNRFKAGDRNIYERLVQYQPTEDLTFAAGLAMNGLRSAAFLTGPALTANYNQLTQLVRQHAPLVVHWISADPAAPQPVFPFLPLQAIAGAGCFQFLASNAQEAIDLAIIAHKVSETALVPGIVALEGEIAYKKATVSIPDAHALVRYLGDPDETIEAPTQAQGMLFGKQRRRIPNWYNPDVPALHGTGKDKQAQALEAVAQQRFFQSHLLEIIQREMEAYAKLSGRKLPALESEHADAEYLVLATGKTASAAAVVARQLRNSDKIKAGTFHLRLLQPFPGAELSKMLLNKKAVTILEPLTPNTTQTGHLLNEVQAVVQGLGQRAPEVFAGQFGSAPSEDSLAVVFKNMLKGGDKKARFVLDLDFSRPTLSSPQYEILLQTIRRDYPGIEGETLKVPAPVQAKPVESTLPLPASVRRFKDQGAPFSRVSRFFHDTASLYQGEVAPELAPDPFQALGTIPVATAGLSDHSPERTVLPVYKADKCSGCGLCLAYCPHSALPSIAISVENLIRGGMDIAASKGMPATSLMPLVKPMAKVASQRIRSAGSGIKKVSQVLNGVFDAVAEQMKLSGEKGETARKDFQVVADILADFPVAVTDPFFRDPENTEKGTGELFSIAVDPRACTGCGCCTEICPEEALAMTPQQDALLQQTQGIFQMWEQLPDTPAATIDRLLESNKIDPFGAISLNRNAYLSMTGGAGAGTPTQVMLHLIATLAESELQPRLAQQASEVKQLIDALSGQIHQKLSDALPREDFSSLARTIEQTKGNKLPLDELITELGSQEHLKLVDTNALQRKVELQEDLKRLHWTLTEGPSGNGRARFGLALEPHILNGLPTFPFNPFRSPVVINWDGHSSGTVRGIMLGIVRHIVDNIKLLRRAKLEIQDKYRPDTHAEAIARLSWADLDESEKAFLPPFLIVGAPGSWNQELTDLLSGDWPVKVIQINNGLPAEGESPAAAVAQLTSGLYAALSMKRLFAIAGSLADPKHLFKGLKDGISRPGPALFQVFAPDASLGHYPNQAQQALQTRAFPVWRYEHQAENDYVAAALSLEGNPSPDQEWHTVQLQYQDEDERKSLTYATTPADWLFAHPGWEEHFQPFSGNASAAMTVAEYLGQGPALPASKTPVIYTIGEAGELKTWSVTPEVIAAAQAARFQWASLREFAGAQTPVLEKMREQTATELALKHEKEVAALRAEFEERLRKSEASFMTQTHELLSEKLMLLVKQNMDA